MRMKSYPGKAKKFESPGGFYDGLAGGSFSGVYYNQPIAYQPWPTLSLPRGFQYHPFQDHPAFPLHHDKRGHTNDGEQFDLLGFNQFYGYQTYREEFQYHDEREQPGDVLEALGEETSNLFQDAFQNSSPRKKSKLSVKLTRRLNCLVQTSGGRSAAVSPVPTGESWDIVAEVHRPSRSYSVDSYQKPTL